MNSSICPGCMKDVSKVRLVNLVYTFEENNEKSLVETAWHKQCFIDAHTPERVSTPKQVTTEAT